MPAIGRGAWHGGVAIIDQAVVSGVNLITSLMLVRYLSADNFGHYVLLFAVLLFGNGLQSALITAPLMVLAPRYDEQIRKRYMDSLWLLQLLVCAGIGGAAALVMTVDQTLGRGWTSAFAIVPTVIVLVSYLGQEFMRRALFLRRDTLSGLMVDVLSYGVQFVALVALIVTGRLTLGTTVWAIGITSVIACAFGVLRLRPQPWLVTQARLWETCQLQWEHGRWLASGALARWSSRQLYLFVTAGMLSPAAAGLLGAGRQVLGVTHLFIDGLENVVPAAVTRRYLRSGVDGMVRWLTRFRWLIVPPIVLYCVVIAVFADPAMRLLSGGKYTDAGTIVALLAVAHVFAPIMATQGFALRALDGTRWLFWARLAAAAVTIVLSIPLVAVAGVTGAAIGLILTEGVTYLTGRIGYRRVVRAAKLHEQTTHTNNVAGYDFGTP